MSRAAARDGFERFLADTVDATREEFSVGRALRGTGLGAGGRVIDRLREEAEALERRVVDPELATYRERALAQFDVILDYAADDRPIGAFEEELLAHDSYVDALASGVSDDRRAAVVSDIVARAERLGDGVAPIVDRPEDEFWAAARGAYDRGEALTLVEEAFPFTGPLVDNRDAFRFAVEIDPADVLGGLGSMLPGVDVEYTDEAIRAMSRAERRIVRETKGEVRERFD